MKSITVVLGISEQPSGGSEFLSPVACHMAYMRGHALREYHGIDGLCVVVTDGSPGSAETAHNIIGGIVGGTASSAPTFTVSELPEVQGTVTDGTVIVVIVKDVATLVTTLTTLVGKYTIHAGTLDHHRHIIIELRDGKINRVEFHSCP